MPVPRLTVENTCCLVVDAQERLIAEMHRPARLLDRCRFLLEVAGLLRLPAAATEQYVRGLGPTVESVRAALPEGSPVIEKTRFSACVDPIRHWLEKIERPNVLLAGIEAHVCVLQTGLDLQSLGHQVFWVSDAISAGEPDQIDLARQRLERGGAVATGCISATYELMADAGHTGFKACLPLIKRLRASGAVAEEVLKNPSVG